MKAKVKVEVQKNFQVYVESTGRVSFKVMILVWLGLIILKALFVHAGR